MNILQIVERIAPLVRGEDVTFEFPVAERVRMSAEVSRRFDGEFVVVPFLGVVGSEGELLYHAVMESVSTPEAFEQNHPACPEGVPTGLLDLLGAFHIDPSDDRWSETAHGCALL